MKHNNIFWKFPFLNIFKKEKEIVVPYKPGMHLIKNKEPYNMYKELKPIDLSKIKFINYDNSNFINIATDKNQLVLHHTVSGDGTAGDLSTWEDNPGRIATCIIVSRDGTPTQLFSSKYWAYHLGAKNAFLDKHSIGVEIDSWGGLIRGDGTTRKFGSKTVKTKIDKYYAAYGNIVDVPMIHYPDKFRGYEYYEAYTDEQIKTVGELLLYWSKRYNIPLTYNEDMWDVSSDALDGKPGVWTHVSYRKPSDKQDCHPQPALIDMLKTLDKIKI